MKFLIILFTLFYTGQIFAADLKGIILEEETNTPIAGATIRVEGKAFGAISNREGYFIISNLKKSSFTLVVSMVGYVRKRVEISNDDFDREITIAITPSPLQTSEIVVTANKRVQAVQEVPISVSIFDNKQIFERSIAKADEALAYVPGLQVKKGSVDIRGASGFALGVGSRVALLLDGFPYLSADNGDMKFDALPLLEIDRIEVVKGAGSALYGTGALGGVINVITSKPEKEGQLKFRSFAGVYTKPRYEQWEYSDGFHTSKSIEASYSKKFGDLGLIAFGSIGNDQSYRQYDDSKKMSAFSKLNYQFSDYFNFSFTGSYAREDRADWVYWNSLDTATFPSNLPEDRNRLQSDKLTLTGQGRYLFDGDNFLIFRTGLFRTELETDHEVSDSDYRQSDANSYNFEIQMNQKISDQLLLTYGVNFNLNEVKSHTYGNENQNIFSGYMQGEYSVLEELTMNLGTRIDYEKTGDLEENQEISPKFGLSYKFDENINFRASIGAGFRAPMVVEKFTTISFGGFDVIPNPDLKPEHSMSYEIGGNYEFNIGDFPFKADMAVFYNNLSDLIEPEIQGTEIIFRNITKANIIGSELALEGFLGFAGFRTALTLMDPRDEATDKMLKYRSEVLWYSQIMFPIGFVQFQADYRYISKMEEVDDELSIAGVKDINARVPVHIVDARLIFDLEKIDFLPVRLSLNAKNLFDYYYTEIIANLGPTRFLSVQVDGKL